MARGESTIGDEAYRATLNLVSGVDVRELPIGPTEAFVLSRIDGLSSLSDLAGSTGLTAEEVGSIVDRLVALGAAEFRSRVAPSAPNAQRSGAHSIPLGLQNQSNATSELSLAQQERLLDLDQRRGSLDHYELLGVSAAADSKAIRAAYYELVHVYHPDRYFGKQLGSYAGLLLRVFGAFTEAYEVLRRDESRAEYDRYLSARTRTRDFDSYFQGSSRESPGAPSSSEASPSAVTSRASLASGSESLRRPSQAPTNDTESRRRALARKLGHSSTPPPTSVSSTALVSASTPPPRSVSSTPPSSAQHAADELKRRYEQRLAQARDEQRTRYLTLAKEAESRNDLIAAANALRLACSLEPGNLELIGDLAELERRAAAALWESYLERAKYAAVEGNLVEAAESYERAALGQPNASLFERAAFYTLESGGDLKHASQLAKQAVAIAPNSAKCRLTLAQIYAAANLRDSALSELERARALEPNQAVIKDWIARVKRGKP